MSNATLTNDVTNDAANGFWWRSAVIYQVYIRSFADGDGDGTGDIAGLRSRLQYLAYLGGDAIWINPWYPSPPRADAAISLLASGPLGKDGMLPPDTTVLLHLDRLTDGHGITPADLPRAPSPLCTPRRSDRPWSICRERV